MHKLNILYTYIEKERERKQIAKRETIKQLQLQPSWRLEKKREDKIKRISIDRTILEKE